MKWTEEMNAWFAAFVPGHEEHEIAAAFKQRFGVELTRSQVKNRKNHLG